jgi:hypothetical protein
MDQKLDSDNFYNIIADTLNFRARPPLFCPIDAACTESVYRGTRTEREKDFDGVYTRMKRE